RRNLPPWRPNGLPRLGAGPHIRLESPGGAGLTVHLKIDFGDAREVDQAALAGALGGILRNERVDLLAVNGTVDHHMADMDAERPEFLGGALREIAKAALGGGKGGEPLLAAHAGGSAR